MLDLKKINLVKHKPSNKALMVLLGTDYSDYKKLWAAIMGMFFFDIMMLLMLQAVVIGGIAYVSSADDVGSILSLVLIAMLVSDSFAKVRWSGGLGDIILQNIPVNRKDKFGKVMGYVPLLVGPLMLFSLCGNNNSILSDVLVVPLILVWMVLRVYLHCIIENVEDIYSDERVMRGQESVHCFESPVRGPANRLYITLGVLLAFTSASILMGVQEKITLGEWLLYSPLLALLAYGFYQAIHYSYIVINLVHDQKKFMFEQAGKIRHIGDVMSDDEKAERVNEDVWYYLDDRRISLKESDAKILKFAIPYTLFVMFFFSSGGSELGGIYGILLLSLYVLKTAVYDIDFCGHLEIIEPDSYFKEPEE